MFHLNKLTSILIRYSQLIRYQKLIYSSKQFTTSSVRFEFENNEFSFDSSDGDDDFINNFKQIITETFQPEIGGRHVFVIQPFVKWGPMKKRDTTPKLQLDEAVALINTLNDWSVEGSDIVPLYSFDKYTFFGTGKLDELKLKINQNRGVTALFLSVNMLSPNQHQYLEEYFSLPVYDRYLIVMQIFREHAFSPEAKLQISLAELPYLYSRMNHIHSASLSRVGGSAARISGTTIHTPEDTRKLILHKYESKLKTSLEKLSKHRESSRKRRKTLNYPVVAVVGYTNAGKTSLIRILTGSNKLVPRNYLFATLDVTFHMAQLPCSMKIFYVDTLGFISDIPTHLIEPFKVTLADAMNADLVVHVQDVSHPDWCFQRDRVTETLESLNIERKLLNHIIPVANKTDLLPNDHEISIPLNTFQISCVTGRGINDLVLCIQEEIIKATGRIHLVIRAKTGGEEYRWLQSEATVAGIQIDPKNYNYSLISVLIPENTLDRFKHTFIKNYVSK